MSLDLSKLEKVRDLASGIVQARCPACAEGGTDRSGEHLRVYPDGKFGCCVHPKDSFHRKRIWVLAGRKLHLSPVNSVSLRFKTPPAIPAAQSVKAALLARTPRTPKTELETSVQAVPLSPVVDSRTPRTGISEFRARARVDSTTDHIWMVDLPEKLKDLESAVRAARTSCGGPPDGHQSRLPFLTAGGDLVIPFDSPERYHWWKPDGQRQCVAATLAEVRSRKTETRLEEIYEN